MRRGKWGNVRFIKPSCNVIVRIGYKRISSIIKARERAMSGACALMSSSSSQEWEGMKTEASRKNKTGCIGYIIPMVTHSLDYSRSIMISNA